MDLRIGSGQQEGTGMLKIGDCVVYVPDGSQGTIVEVADGLYHIVWEDHFSSWERRESLLKHDAGASGKPSEL